MKVLIFKDPVYFRDPENKERYEKAHAKINLDSVSFMVPGVPKKFLLTLQFEQINTTEYEKKGVTYVLNSGDIFYLTNEQIDNAEVKNY